MTPTRNLKPLQQKPPNNRNQLKRESSPRKVAINSGMESVIKTWKTIPVLFKHPNNEVNALSTSVLF